MSVSVENFVKVVYQHELDNDLETRPGTIARALGITSAAATDMSRKLSARNLIRYKKYQKLRLTADGRAMALHVIRKHRLWETFLFRVFDLSLHEIHREAELLEHQTSDFLAEKISSFLGRPDFDPHGEPIPDAGGSMQIPEEQWTLSNATPGFQYQITGLISSDREFFDFCQLNQVTLNNRLKIVARYAGSKLTEIIIHQKKMLLPIEFARNIRVLQQPESSSNQ